MRPQDLIQIKRDSGKFSKDEINAFIDGVCDKTWTNYQISALLMAIFIRGLDEEEQNFLTEAMLRSGEILDFSAINLPKADKHSTGGVGDKTSLIIAPLAACCGVAVPMISGRGLGHTGGTLDKLEAIPGYNVNLSTEKFHEIIEKCGFAMTGQTAKIAPADKTIYSLRDATATVPYIPLIVASIMSKKLAEGLDTLVLDVKTGSGAFMQKFEDSKKLAKALVNTGNNFGVKTEAVISDMSQPLGKFVGNALEVYECIKILRNETEEKMLPTLELSVELTARMLVLSGVSASISNSKFQISDCLKSGKALEKFRENVELQGGDPKVCDAPEMLLDSTLYKFEVTANSSGFVSEIDTCALGNAIVEIGGGRTKAEDSVDAAVGFACEKYVGDEINAGEPLGILYCRAENQAHLISEKMQNAYKISESQPQKIELIREIVL
ncbi:MAG TPA: thymidine phosphorylase [Pyrinomonadaceae bacterium]|nr:thymidine phosphorylase [Pyrinomonadaceae bacterium]